MLQQVISLCVCLLLLGSLAPARAENLVNPALLDPNPAREATRFHYESPEAQAGGTTAQAPAKTWSLKGKVLFWVGLGLAASGAVELGFAQTLKDSSTCSGGGNYRTCVSYDYSVARDIYRGTGYASIGIGAVLMAVGATRRD